VRSREPCHLEGRKDDRDDGRNRCDREATQEKIPAATRQEHPRRAGTEIGHCQDAAGDVVRAEERRAPSAALSRSFARSGNGEEGKAHGPQGLLSRRPSQQRTKQEERERRRQESCCNRRHRIRDCGNVRPLPVGDDRDGLAWADHAQIREVAATEHPLVARRKDVLARFQPLRSNSYGTLRPATWLFSARS
jgi:hypothetical protein